MQGLLRKHGAVPVNDAIFPLWEDSFDILLLYGGRGGGKSEAVCDKLLDECINDEYFKCYYGRKVFDTVRGSCFATLDYCIKKNKLGHLFSYSTADTSSMIITCIKNGNKFIPFGSDKADKLKSIKDPTHVWGEEFDQFAFDDFKNLFPTLRTVRGKNRFLATFNTHDVHLDHWIIKLFFPNLYQGNDKEDLKHTDLLKSKEVLKLFVNYTDNHFIDKEAYTQTLWLSSAGNPQIFEGIANGVWGMKIVDNPWAYAFDRGKHVAIGELFATRSEFLWLSFDFNRNPATVSIIQHSNGCIYVIETVKIPKSGTEGLCDYILEHYPNYVYMVTGDYSGHTASSIYSEEQSNFTMIRAKLNLSEGQFKVYPNPRLQKNQLLVNAVLHQYKVQLCPRKARPLIFDMENVQKRADGTIIKEDRNDPAQQADAIDTFRYYCNAEMQWIIPNS